MVAASARPSPSPAAAHSMVAYAAKTPAPPASRRKAPRAKVTPPPQSASFNLGAQDGAFLVSVSSFGKKYTVDRTKVHFTVRSLESRGAARTSLHAEVGDPVFDRSFDQDQGSGTVTGYHLPIAFPDRPEHPGMYDVAVVADSGFTRYDDGSVLRAEGAPHVNVYWPDDTGDDAALRAARGAVENHTVYGYGGIALSCGAASSKTYLANVGVAIQSVERRHGAVQQLWTGALPSWGNDAAYSFFAVDPLAVKATYPAAASFGSSSSSAPAGDAPCPGFFLADWQLDVTLTTTKPPPLPGSSDQYTIAFGMSRADVAWRRGYPQGYATRAVMNGRSVWAYEDGPGDAYTVTFRNGRVVAFTVPPGLP